MFKTIHKYLTSIPMQSNISIFWKTIITMVVLYVVADGGASTMKFRLCLLIAFFFWIYRDVANSILYIIELKRDGW